MLCHILPRDNVMRFCVVLLCAAFILQAVALGERGNDGSCGSYRKAGSQTLFLNMELKLIWDDQTVVCTNHDGSAANCKHFIRYMRVAGGFAVAAFISTPIAMGIISAAIVPLASTTAKMVIGFYVSVLFPFIATLICTIVFFSAVVPEGGKPYGFSDDDYSRGKSVNLYVASTALHCFGFLLATIRLLTLLLLRPAQKREMIQTKNIDSIMVLHMVNDDWDRQKKVWKGHLDFVNKALEEEDAQQRGRSSEQRVPAEKDEGAASVSTERLAASQVLDHTVSSMDDGTQRGEDEHEPFPKEPKS